MMFGLPILHAGPTWQNGSSPPFLASGYRVVKSMNLFALTTSDKIVTQLLSLHSRFSQLQHVVHHEDDRLEDLLVDLLFSPSKQHVSQKTSLITTSKRRLKSPLLHLAPVVSGELARAAGTILVEDHLKSVH